MAPRWTSKHSKAADDACIDVTASSKAKHKALGLRECVKPVDILQAIEYVALILGVVVSLPHQLIRVASFSYMDLLETARKLGLTQLQIASGQQSCCLLIYPTRGSSHTATMLMWLTSSRKPLRVELVTMRGLCSVI